MHAILVSGHEPIEAARRAYLTLPLLTNELVYLFPFLSRVSGKRSYTG
jgi:hypothetical protein